MADFALIIDGVVRNVEQHDALPEMHPSLVWVPCPGDARPGWAYAGGAFVPPAVDHAAVAAALVLHARTVRNGRLAASDWTQTADAPLSDEQKASWRAHRQALRDWPGAAGFPDLTTMPAAL